MRHGHELIRLDRTCSVKPSAALLTRRELVAMLLTAAGCATGCRRQRCGDFGNEVDCALNGAMRALIAVQSPDGAWRSQTYGALKDGLSLTPSVLKAVVFGPSVEGSATAQMRGAAYLAGRVRPDGSIDAGPDGLGYPVYTAAAAAIVLGRIDVAGYRTACDAWLRELRRRQLTEALGWSPSDLAYGGWGDSFAPSVKRALSERPTERSPDADLSSTLFAVGALRMTGASDADFAIHKALAFVEQCQNFAGEGRADDPAYDDGGFFFSPVEPERNKAGAAGTDRGGRLRYHSYGSATADGLRALLRCGRSLEEPRVRAARAWLEENFSSASHPGLFEPTREVERDAMYYYYSWSVAHALRAIGVREIKKRGGMLDWVVNLARELIVRQRRDGMWVNRFSAAKEDDPLVATALAAGALGTCRMMMTPR